MVVVDEVGVMADGVTLLAPVSVIAERRWSFEAGTGTGKTTLLRVLAGTPQAVERNGSGRR
jgi:ABC-type molybdenum transport system ATPase subunit/photorepair protein PhrA